MIIAYWGGGGGMIIGHWSVGFIEDAAEGPALTSGGPSGCPLEAS